MAIGAFVVAMVVSGAEGGIYTAGMLIGIGGIILGLGIWRVVHWRRTRGRSFSVHERGLVCRTAEAVTVVPWSSVAQVHASQGDGLPLAEVRGAGFGCRIVLHDGSATVFDAFIEDAWTLVEAVRRGVLSQGPSDPDEH